MPDVDWTAARPVTVRLSDFAFTPNHLSFEVGVPVHLTLVNVGSGAHDFSAPRFLSTAAYPPGAAMPVPDGDITLKAGQTLELDFVPRLAGTYPLECTEFLHAMFGMTGTIEVTSRQSAASRIN
jgi:plastocyanin